MPNNSKEEGEQNFSEINRIWKSYNYVHGNYAHGWKRASSYELCLYMLEDNNAWWKLYAWKIHVYISIQFATNQISEKWMLFFLFTFIIKLAVYAL